MTALLILLSAVSVPSFAQGPLQKRIDFTINVPYRLQMGDYVMPPGKYIVRQVIENDLNLFHLFRRQLGTTPIAAIRTVRVDYTVKGTPDDAMVHWRSDLEGRRTGDPVVITGWDIPGMDGWTIISVVPDKSSRHYITRVR
jgi:hypothetical protein